VRGCWIKKFNTHGDELQLWSPRCLSEADEFLWTHFPFHFHLSNSQIEFSERQRFSLVEAPYWWRAAFSEAEDKNARLHEDLTDAIIMWTAPKQRLQLDFGWHFHILSRARLIAADWFMLSVCHNRSAITGIKAMCSHNGTNVALCTPRIGFYYLINKEKLQQEIYLQIVLASVVMLWWVPEKGQSF